MKRKILSVKKKQIIWASIVFSAIAFITPFVFRAKEDSIITILSTSFTAVSMVTGLSTLLIAVLLYDRFGLEGKFIENQTNKVLELVNLLKGREVIARTKGMIYFIRPSQSQLKIITKLPPYEKDKNKLILLTPDSFSGSMNAMLSIQRSYWLPKVIKEKMSFIEGYGLLNERIESYDQYVKLDFKNSQSEEWRIALPEMTFENFIDNLQSLIKEIEDWLRNHSSVLIDYRMEEPNQHLTHELEKIR